MRVGWTHLNIGSREYGKRFHIGGRDVHEKAGINQGSCEHEKKLTKRRTPTNETTAIKFTKSTLFH